MKRVSPQTEQRKYSPFQKFVEPTQLLIKKNDLNDEEIQGTFYEQELQKTTQEVFKIEKVVKKGKTKSLVKWKGYPASFNSWVDKKDLIKL